MISVGDKFGALEVVKLKSSKRYGKQWFHTCRCACGSIREYSGCHLATGATKSCGCVRAKKSSRRLTKHGYAETKTYKIWKGIKRRCYNKNDLSYSRYGGAGIKMQESWKNSFVKFLNDMGECPEGLSIDRIDGSKGYFKSNCRWANIFEQAWNHKSRTRLPKGVRKLPSGSYAAHITARYVYRYLGSFATLNEAVRARKEAEDKYFV